jgi:choline-sulfatase
VEEKLRARGMNIVFLFSHEHSAAAMGNAGHPIVRTPNMDRLAEQSTVFDNAYCTSPICTPSRLSMLTGLYPHQIEAWDLGAIADPDRHQTWGHYLQDHQTVLCGRTHFNGLDRRLGFSDRLLDDLPKWNNTSGRPPQRGSGARRGSNSHVAECGAGYHPHSSFDALAADLAVQYLDGKASATDASPFLLYCGFVLPHFPLIAHPDYYDLYDPRAVTLPDSWNEPLDQQHPIIQHLRCSWRNETPPPEEVVRCATASYYALITYLDEQVGRILHAIDESSLRENTVVIYTSDHGEMAGHHGIWQKQCFYDAAVRVPLMVRNPAGGAARRVAQNVSLVDILPTLLDIAGVDVPSHLPGSSLLELLRGEPENATRAVFAEYHHMGLLDAGFMLKKGHHKLCHYVGSTPQLFDVGADPLENHDLAQIPEHAATLADLDATLHGLVDPEAVNERCKQNQAARA